MLTLYHASGSGDFQLLEPTLDDDRLRPLVFNVRRLLEARGYREEARLLQTGHFELWEGTNHFNDEFAILCTWVPLARYEALRRAKNQIDFSRIAKTFEEVGHYVRFIACELLHAEEPTWDAFVCHASEDKETVAVPLVAALEEAGIGCWYDEGEIRWGDGVTEKINEGLEKSRFVIVVLSRAFLDKKWARQELSAALNQEITSGRKKVLPLLVGTDQEREAIQHAFILQRDKRYVTWTGNPGEVVAELRRLLELGDRLALREV